MSTETIDANVARIKSNIAKSYANCERLYATMPSVRNLENLADCIESIKVIGKNATVLFIDSCVPRVYEAWSAENMAVADALPTPPTYDGMTFEGWGLTLAEVQGITEKTTLLPKYMSADGTRLHITVTAQDEVAITFASGTVGTVDFGEGGVQTITESMAHTYTASGDYVITVRGTGYTIMDYNDRLRSAIRRVVVAEECVALPLSDMDLCEYINYAPNGVVVQNNGSLRCLPYKDFSNEVGTLTETFKGNTYAEYAPMLPPSATVLNGVFNGCRMLSVMPSVPSGATDLESLFYACNSMPTAPVLPSGVTSLNSTFYACTSLREPPVLPSGVTSLNSTFYYCTSLREPPVLPSGVTSLNSTFYVCTSLREPPVLPSGVTSLYQAFNGCNRMAVAPEVPPSVTNIEEAFSSTGFSHFYLRWYLPFNKSFTDRYHYHTLTLHCLTAEPIALTYANPFWDPEYPVQEFIIKVPRSADHSILNAYKTATGWCEYADKIYEEDEDFVAPPSPYETE